MSEDKLEMGGEGSDQAQAQEPAAVATDKAPKADIADELQELGRQLTAATKAVLESPEAKEVGSQLQQGLESLEKAVGQMMGQVRESKVGKTVEGTVTDAAHTVQERGVLDTLAETVTSALVTVNRTLGEAVTKMEARAEKGSGKRQAPQQIEVVDAEDEPLADPEVSEE
jgi:hypothetical protein